MLKRYFQPIKLTYGITVCNEAVEVERLILFLLLHKDRRDEIVVLQDVTNRDQWVTDVLAKYRDKLVVREAALNNDFASFKNNLIQSATGDYLFQIDADEQPNKTLLRGIKDILRKQKISDSFAIPRVNYVKGLTPEFIRKWNWQVDAKGRINFPDYQVRLFRLNQSISWRNKVHEELEGHHFCYFLPSETEEFCLLHIKDLERQKRQNEFYEQL